MALQYPSHNMSQMLILVLLVLPNDIANQHLKSIRSLPKSYIDVSPISLSNDVIPTVADQQLHALPAEKNDDQRHKLWLEHVRAELAKEQTEAGDYAISWCAFFATLQLSMPSHIEMAMLKVKGDWLDGSGWTYHM